MDVAGCFFGESPAARVCGESSRGRARRLASSRASGSGLSAVRKAVLRLAALSMDGCGLRVLFAGSLLRSAVVARRLARDRAAGSAKGRLYVKNVRGCPDAIEQWLCSGASGAFGRPAGALLEALTGCLARGLVALRTCGAGWIYSGGLSDGSIACARSASVPSRPSLVGSPFCAPAQYPIVQSPNSRPFTRPSTRMWAG